MGGPVTMGPSGERLAGRRLVPNNSFSRQGNYVMLRLNLLSVLAVVMLAAPVDAQPRGKAMPIKAEQLAKDCSADSSKAEAKYKGKTLRVAGVVGDIYDDLLYLPVKVNGQEVSIVIRFGAGKKPNVKKGDEATFEGKFDRVAVLGPALVGCKLVSRGGKK